MEVILNFSVWLESKILNLKSKIEYFFVNPKESSNFAGDK